MKMSESSVAAAAAAAKVEADYKCQLVRGIQMHVCMFEDMHTKRKC